MTSFHVRYALTLLIALNLCSCKKDGDSDDSEATDSGETVTVKAGFAAAIDQLAIALPKVGTSTSLASAESLETPWNDTTIFSNNDYQSPKEFVQFMYNRDESQSLFGRLRGKFNNSCALLAALTLDEENLPKVGTQTITENEAFVAKVKKNCPDFDFSLAALATDEADATTVKISAIANGIYDRKVVITGDGEENGDETFYIAFRSNVMRFSSWEDNSSITGKGDISGSFFEYNKSTKITNFQYYKKTFLTGMTKTFELYKINLDEASDGHPAFAAAMVKQGETLTDSGFTASYNADKGTTSAISVTAESTLADGNGCVKLADLTVTKDETLTCESTGKASSTYIKVGNKLYDAWKKSADLKTSEDTVMPFTDVSTLLSNTGA